MRFLIISLLLVGSAAGFFYTHNPRQRIEPTVASDAFEIRDAAKPTDDDEAAQFRQSNDANIFDPPTNDALPAVKSPDSQGPPNRAQHAEAQENALRSSAGDLLHAKQRRASSQWFSLILSLERRKAQSAFDSLATVRRELAQAQKQRSGLVVELSDLGGDASKLRSSLQAKGNEIADLQHRLADVLKKDASAADSDHAKLLAQLVSLQNKFDGAVAQKQEADDRLARSENLAANLRTKLTQLGASSQQAASQAQDKQENRVAAVDRYYGSISQASQKLRDAEATVRDISVERDAATARASRVSAQLIMATSGLLAARVGLASAAGRAAADQHAASDKARQLSTDNEALRKRSEAADARINKMESASSRTAKLAADTQAQMRSLKARSENADVAMTDQRELNTKLKIRLDTVALGMEKELADLKKKNGTLAVQAERLPQLTHDLDKGWKERNLLKGIIATLTSQNAEQAARLDVSETAEKVHFRERGAAVISAFDRAKQLTSENDTLRERSSKAEAQVEMLNGALSHAKTMVAATPMHSQNLEHRRASVEVALADARAETERLAARLAVVTSNSDRQLTELREQNVTLAGEAGKLPQLELRISESRTKLSALENLIAAMKSENGEQHARIDALTKTKNSSEMRLSKVELARQASTTVEDERMRKLGEELASAREKLAGSMKDERASNDARRLVEKALTDTKAKLLSERRQVAVTADRPISLKQQTKQASKVAASQLEGRVQNSEPKLESPPPASDIAEPSGDVTHSALPDAVAKRVLLRYVNHKARSQSRAQALQVKLRGFGIDVTTSAETAASKEGDTVSYYYVQDRGMADQVAQQINAPAPTRISAERKQFRRPGTIEISVGG